MKHHRLQLLLQTGVTPIFFVCFSCNDMTDMVEYITQSHLPWHEVFQIKNVLTGDELLGSRCALHRHAMNEVQNNPD